MSDEQAAAAGAASPGAALPDAAGDAAALQRRGHRYGGAIYGGILALSVLVVASAGTSSPWVIAVTVLVTSLVFWMAHVYSELLGRHITSGRLTTAEAMAVARDEWPMAQASLPIVAVVLLGALPGISGDSTPTYAGLVGVLMLFGWGVVVARAEGRRPLAVLLVGLVNATFGLLIVALKLLVH